MKYIYDIIQYYILLNILNINKYQKNKKSKKVKLEINLITRFEHY